MAIQDLSGRSAARARRDAQVYGKAALPAKSGSTASASAKTRPAVSATAPVSTAMTSAPAVAAPVLRASAQSNTKISNAGREASRARRQSMSSRGKAGVAVAGRQRVAEDTRSTRTPLPGKDCGCGCKGAGNCGDENATSLFSGGLPAGYQPPSSPRRAEIKVVSPTSAGRINSRMRRQSLAAHGKNGADAFRKGLSAAQLVRQQNPDISGRELARTVRVQRSSNGSQGVARSAPVGRKRPQAGAVSGTKVSHSDKTTGDETGLCRAVTGTDYFSSDVFAEFCQKEPPSVPRKVETSENLSGGTITASGKVGRSENVTGNERGSCRNVTGVEYVGREQYDNFCATKPEPGSAKVSFSQTTRGQIISGSKPARSRKVSGDEAGTCKAVTGTPYAGIEQFREFCQPGESNLAEVRNQRRSGNAGRDITGMQPGFAGLTGAGKGACRDVSGTAYIGADQFQAVCGTVPAQIGEADFPQPLTGAPWGAFSVLPPVHASQPVNDASNNVTGMRYEQGRVSGTFSLGEGKITGTEQFRFGDSKVRGAVRAPVATLMADAEAAKASRVTGEGMDTSMKITGNDWNRGEHVTGTEGASAKRNPTRRGPVSAMSDYTAKRNEKRNEEVVRSDIKVTGGCGTSESGAPVTVSGGARG